MSFAPLQGMDRVVQIEFAEALAELQGLMRRPVRIYVNAHGTLCGCMIEGELDRVETLPPDDAAVEMVIGAQRVVLDPADLSCLSIDDPAAGGAVEFALKTGVAIRVEPVERRKSR